MAEPRKEWTTGRVFHFSGGLRAINWFTPGVHFEPKTLDGKFLQMNSRSFGGTFAELESSGLSIVGVDFYTSRFETEGQSPPQWRTHHSPIRGWPCEDTIQIWRQIAHAAFTRKKGRLWDIASRVAHQLSVCHWRVRDVSEAYKNLLLSCRWDHFKVGRQFKNGFSWLAYSAMQSFLVDACILRDYLAEFAAFFIYVTDTGEPVKKLTTLGSLKRFVLRHIEQTDPLTLSLKMATADDGWLKELGDYRDLIMHSAPLAHGESTGFAVEDEIIISGDHHLPRVLCPIPGSPQEIFAKRTSGAIFDTFQVLSEAFTKAARGESSAKDGLPYMHSVLGELCKLSHLASEQCPVKPEPIIITDSDVIKVEVRD
ncbi:MAG TPA: hypothetical protein VJS13_11500 [Pyrinomonadaceae bacterium]|nr:hypothetical protein [Pyrinomonadaceae bacterium]